MDVAKTMRFGLILPSKGEGTGPDLLDAGAETARRLGWTSVWVTDHMMVPPGDEADEYGTILEAVTALAWVGGRHPGLTLGTSVIVPAMRDAVQLAKEFATLDVLTGGRLVVGVGVGDEGDIAEYTNLGKADRFRVRGAYLDETIALWRHLWSGRTEPFHGRFHTLEDFTFRPLPPQGSQLRIWSGGRSAKAVDRCIRLTDGYHASQTGPADLRERLPGLLDGRRALGRAHPTLSIRTRVKFGAPRGPVYSLVGSARDMVADLVAFDALGVDDIIVVLEGHDPEAIRDGMERFDHEVVRPYRETIGEDRSAERETYSM
jgi:alkanesulfonate monooxygenase SsuD/methylene tetrahydromethanopterin reductase-like flavin-dependent oxidoreductase (luciferase family)